MNESETILSGLTFIFIMLLSYLLGYTSGLSKDYTDAAVIREVNLSKSENGKYEYSTNQFDFISDSIYMVGDTVKIIRYYEH